MKHNDYLIVNMSLSDEDYLFKTAERFADWAQNFVEASVRNIPEKPLEDFNHYNQYEIFGFKMMASFSLELYMKAYFYTLIHKNYSNKTFVNNKELQKFLREIDYNTYTHSLKTLKGYIIKEDASFKDANLDKAISYFDCFDEIRYPTPSKNPNQIIGLFEYNDDMWHTFLRTYEYLRNKSREYIIPINQKITDELEHESEEAKELSEYEYQES